MAGRDIVPPDAAAIPIAVEPPVPPIDDNCAGEHDDERLSLSLEHAQQADHFRKGLRLCDTDTEKYELCVRKRDELLGQDAGRQILTAVCEYIMFRQCPLYTEWKEKRSKVGEPLLARSREETPNGDDAAQWERFVDAAEDGSKVKVKCLSAMKEVSRCWGRDVVQHYQWVSRGEKYRNQLRTAARKVPIWSQAVAGLNLSILDRSKRLQRRFVRVAVNPIDPIDLVNLTARRYQDPSAHQSVTAGDLPDGFGFDKFGLIVHKAFAAPLPEPSKSTETTHNTNATDNDTINTADTIEPVGSPVLHDTQGAATVKAAASSAFPSTGTTGTAEASGTNYTGLTDPPPAVVSGESGRTVAGAVLTAASDIITDASHAKPENGISMQDTGAPTTPHVLTGMYSLEDAGSSPQNIRRSQRRRTQPSYLQLAGVRVSKRNDAPPRPNPPRPSPPKVKAPRPKRTPKMPRRCCPAEVPSTLLSALDHDESVFGTEMVEQFSPHLRRLCHLHLQLYAERTSVIASARRGEEQLDGEGDSNAVQSADTASQPETVLGRRRTASLGDINQQMPAEKRPRTDDLDGPLPSSHPSSPLSTPGSDTSRPAQHREADDAYRKEFLARLEETTSQAAEVLHSHGEAADRLISIILQRAEQPNTDGGRGAVEAIFSAASEAACRVDAAPPDVPIFTDGQQHFRWKGRPIPELFRRMEDLDRSVSVQVPSRRRTADSFERHDLREVQRRFLAGGATDDPWNILDLRSPLPPSTLPAFLSGEDCQLLPRIRDAVFSGHSAQRAVASTAKWNEWTDVLDWVLLSEGGHNTPPHMDGHGLATWFTVQEGRFGFGWLSRPTEEEREGWMADPQGYTGGRWRYVVLRPGQSVFFNSGTIHFVFRLRGGEQTLALGGHVLQWSGVERWLRTVAAQVRNPNVVNEDMEWSAPKYVQVVERLVQKRVEDGKVEQFGGLAAANRFLASAKEFKKLYRSRRRKGR